ncbi:MAG TPA: RNA 3'-terminal phosphate cyclase [Candidatus Thermoplasmatota archaeon]|nr:RNA 3'-terminal phosphate cyclase [Candidatus Thermoplasmatota archaeon]
MIDVDGAQGEGGGQVLRVALALAAATGKDVRVANIRVKRPNPGLAPQHAVSVQAFAEITDGAVEGASRGSTTVVFRPGAPTGGTHELHVPTAGSITILLQAVLPVAVVSGKTWVFDLKGGTDVLWAPPWDHFDRVHRANLARLGVASEATLKTRGFYPVGGGEATVEVHPSHLHGGDLVERGDLRRIEGTVATSGLPEHVAERAEAAVRERLFADLGHGVDLRLDRAVQRGPGKGLSVSLRALYDDAVLGADAVGRLGYPAEKVGDDAARGLVAEARGGGAVDAHESDALLVYLALAGGGSLTCRGITEHARTVMDVVPLFLPVRFDVEESPGRAHITVV